MLCSCCSGSRLGDFLAASLAGLFVLAVIVTIWLLIKASELVIRMLIRYPTNLWLWLAVGAFITSLILVGLTSEPNEIVDSLPWICFFSMVIVAKVVDIYYDELLQRAWSRQAFAHGVAREPWWSL